jgi:hypothetical protein
VPRRRIPKASEIRLNDDGTVDEIVTPCRHFHIEQMNDSTYWVGITLANGDQLSLAVGAKSLRAKGSLVVTEAPVWIRMVK